MIDQYFGTKELYQVTLRANTDMVFGERVIERGEPVIYFEKVNAAMLNEDIAVKMARGGWNNMPRIVWENRSEITFTMSEGVMNNIGMGLLFSAKTLKGGELDATYIPRREGPFVIERGGLHFLDHTPCQDKPMFCYEYDRNVIQKKTDFVLDGKKIVLPNGTAAKEYIFDYYYQYDRESIRYLIEKQRFNGTFSLEAKFRTKDENDGINVTNLIIMPKVRVESDISLRLGEGVAPAVSTFQIIAMPVQTVESSYTLMTIDKLSEDVDEIAD